MSNVSSDPIADMLARIRNALAVRKTEISMPHSQFKQAVAQLLKDNHYISGVYVDGEGIAKSLKLTLHDSATNSNITDIQRVSKPGRRVYASADEIPRVKQGRGIVIVSTSKGLMVGTEAKKHRLGGELICEVY